MQSTSKNLLVKVKTIGLVPTMGALHDGHLSLVRRSKEENDVTVVSIFVNPIQFGPAEDFDRYPRDIDGDTEKLSKAGVDILFMPAVHAVYPEGFSTGVEVEGVSSRLCGAFRPGHFRGVATVVAKLFNIIRPARAYFGAKDFQQTVVIQRMAKDLDMDTGVIVCPTIREKDGLAMSSRNAYLEPAQRKAAGVIFRCLTETSDLIKSGIIDGLYLRKVMIEKLGKEPAVTTIDYAGVYDPVLLDELSEIKGDVLIAIALKIGNTRLIDNMLVSLSKGR